MIDKKQNKDIIYNIIIFFCVVCIIAFFVRMFSGPNLTELYFENHETLPFKIEINNKYNFAFTVHNLDKNNINYTYRMIEEIGNEREIIKEESFILNKYRMKSFTADFNITKDFDYAKIKVELSYLNKYQEIHFYVHNKKH